MDAALGQAAVPSPGEGSPPEKPYHPKRPHKKSRKGCMACKTRKVKCDEHRPVCRNCRLRSQECVYANLPDAGSGSLSSASPTSSSSAALVRAAAAPPIILEPQLLPPDFDETAMRFLWYYTTNTCSSFTIEGGDLRPIEDIMRTTVVQYAFSSPFLMDSLLGLASLHQQTLLVEHNQRRAIAYRARAFQGYRDVFNAPTGKDRAAMLANSLLLVALASENFRDLYAPKCYIVNWMVVWRGIGMLIDRMGPEEVKASGLERLFYRPQIDLGLSAADIPSHLVTMIENIKENDLEYEHVPLYYRALKFLGSLFQNLRLGGFGAVMRLRIITWLTFLPEDFVKCVQKMLPRALVIMAHYAPFLKLMSGVWWLKGVGNRSLHDLVDHLGPRWGHVLTMPQNAIREEDELKIARIILGNPRWFSETPAGRYWDAQQEAETRELTWVDNEGRAVRASTVTEVPDEFNVAPEFSGL
ncbi:C6 zinc finger domain-containingprotein [Purpureocillium lavendulum]|uniref:C6 zinc finger domain-containingprotein n=1 Tax=Purpureocillium lavendulum TaxID=1247861 RepID=A0AB34FN67_9HYPO|nr:C6 zinc finger domain-containingprotein [Purpureocillium lavendulum]